MLFVVLEMMMTRFDSDPKVSLVFGSLAEQSKTYKYSPCIYLMLFRLITDAVTAKVATMLQEGRIDCAKASNSTVVNTLGMHMEAMSDCINLYHANTYKQKVRHNQEKKALYDHQITREFPHLLSAVERSLTLAFLLNIKHDIQTDIILNKAIKDKTEEEEEEEIAAYDDYTWGESDMYMHSIVFKGIKLLHAAVEFAKERGLYYEVFAIHGLITQLCDHFIRYLSLYIHILLSSYLHIVLSSYLHILLSSYLHIVLSSYRPLFIYSFIYIIYSFAYIFFFYTSLHRLIYW